MKTTYKEILNNMKTAYFERCGEAVTDFSDTAARLEAVASELFSLACSADYVLRQAFPQTAAGEYLDFHAALRDITRKQPSFSQGELTFYVNEASESDIEIPEGTLCSKAGEPYIQFETVQTAVLSAGETEASVPVLATESGAQHNADAGTVTVMVNPPTGIDGVYNASPIKGGSALEGDEALRERIMNSYAVAQSGYSSLSIKEAVLRKDEVLDCSVYFNSGEIVIPLRLKTGGSIAEVAAELEEELTLARLLDYSVNAFEAASADFSLSLEIKSASADTDEAEQNARKAAEEFLTSVKIGNDIRLSELVYYVSKADGVSYCEASSPQAVQGLILCPQNSYLSLSELRVSCYE